MMRKQLTDVHCPMCPWGLMCSTSNNIRFNDRDVSAALNIRRCAVGPRPTELCYWEGRLDMPKPGQPG
ncbi:hypothetical protein HaLaN_05335 [Haematococcus lacustris]|uniref:Uncharacterized protein n=1 Tax=Haematococcus lacustris TaxID=44745 RepID=A0A699YTE5_HAELA|nr:hypothetical protein HaLaN_05335 [Haematococcus lacustris]